MRNRNNGFMALFLIGGYLLWRNRFEIQRFLEARGIDTNLDTSSIGNTIRSGVAKVSGNVEHSTREAV